MPNMTIFDFAFGNDCGFLVIQAGHAAHDAVFLLPRSSASLAPSLFLVTTEALHRLRRRVFRDSRQNLIHDAKFLGLLGGEVLVALGFLGDDFH